jgi:hypothetical protein
VELSDENPIFVGFKLDSSLRRQIESLSGPDSKYVSSENSTFLRLCSKGETLYVGKVIEKGFRTDHVDDVRRNILSIMQRLCPDVRLPDKMDIWACRLPAFQEAKKPSIEGF